MTTETILTDEQIAGIAKSTKAPGPLTYARNIEQAVLQSPEIQALRKDAERLEFMEKDSGQTIFRRGSDWYTSPQRYPGAATPRAVRHKTMRDAIDAAMEQQK